ncbi:hypothetical protein INT45_012362, partial [Circinella minor]
AFLPSISFPRPIDLVTSRIFRISVLPKFLNNPNYNFVEPLGTRQWRRFWSIPLNSIVQNFWFHILHQTVPNATTLHNTAANIPPSTSCLFCNSPDSLCHFLYSCPVKWAVWHTIWFDLLLYTLTINDVHHAIFSLRFPHNPSSLDTHTLLLP